MLVGTPDRRPADGSATDDGSTDDGSTDDDSMAGRPTRVEAIVRVANVAEHPRTTYRIDPEELFAVVEEIEERDLEVAGFYHSHPTGPRSPSKTDVARATWTDHVYLIVSLDGSLPFLGAWIWDGERFVDETVRVV